MNVLDFAKQILTGGTLEHKLLSRDLIDWSPCTTASQRLERPCREGNIKFSKEQVKFPGKGALKHEKERGKALHFFANHELLAIEMFAQALLLFPEMEQSQQKLLVNTLEEEQKHFSLYVERMKDFGVTFGDYPLNDFFWSFIDKVQTVEQFFAVISLTFEQANLDFAKYYYDLFLSIGDIQTADVMKTVYEDEIKHVARGKKEVFHQLQLSGKDQESLWEYYCSVLPEPLTPARAKGMIFDSEGRRKAGLGEDYISSLEKYRNSFSVTERRQWQK